MSRALITGSADGLGRESARRFASAMRTLDPQSLSQHVDRLYRAAWALCGSREDAEDLVQETFARVLSRPRVLQGDGELYYLMRVLRNTFLTGLGTASRRPRTVAALEDVVASDPNPLGRPDWALEVKELYATIAELPEDFRLALVAVDVLGLSYRDAARALRVREATITTRLFRARKQIAQRLLPEPARDEIARDRASEPGRSSDSAGSVHPQSSRQAPQRVVRREDENADGVLSTGEAQ
jgi:RNA polymerase sigma-70 factor (ECF subfamily)